MNDNEASSCLRPFALQTAGVAAVVNNIEDGHHVGDATCFVTNTLFFLPPLPLSNSIQQNFVNNVEDGHLDGDNCLITNTILSLNPLPRGKQFSPKGLGFVAPPTSEEIILILSVVTDIDYLRCVSCFLLINSKSQVAHTNQATSTDPRSSFQGAIGEGDDVSFGIILYSLCRYRIY